MKLRSVTNWTTRTGKRRTIRLYGTWRNLQARVAGKLDGAKRARWKGLPIGFTDWPHFRAWALSTGFRKGLVLGRKREREGYGPDNCEWITQAANADQARNVHKKRCKCFWCKSQRGME